jgi:hypothetical protein
MTGSGIASPIPLVTGGYTRSNLRTELARFFGYHEGTATANGTTGTLVDSKLSRFADDYFIGANIWIETSPSGPEGQDSFVSDFARSTGTLTFTPAMTLAPLTTDAYHLYLNVTKVEMDTAIARASAGGQAQYALTPVTTTLDYDLTTAYGLAHPSQIQAVMHRYNADTELPLTALSGWSVSDNYGTLTLHLRTFPATADTLYVVYLLDGTYPLDDAQRSNLPMSLVKVRALCYLLTNMLPRQDASGADKWGQLLRFQKEELVQEERKWQRGPSRVQKQDWLATGSTFEQLMGWTVYSQG